MNTPARPALSVIERAVLAEIAALPLARGARVLDAPCGAGGLVAALQDAGYDAHGADIVPGATALLGDRFLQSDLGAGISAPDASFDLVLSVEGMEHLENPYAFLREIRRVLRPGGYCIVTTPNTVSIRSRVRFAGSGFYNQDPRPLNEDARHPLHHIALMTFPELRYAFHTSGLTIARLRHTHIKPVSVAYALFFPWIAAYTTMAFRKEKNLEQRTRNRHIRRALLSPSLLFGENVMLIARKT